MRNGSWDAIVVGSGPAGATAAALLARSGQRVLVLEKERFPRFHIGESLLPASLPVLERLDVGACPNTFVFKRGAEFVCATSGRTCRFDFADALPGCPRYAWHVDRASFDTLLRDRAVAEGAEVRHGETVTDVDTGEDRVSVKTEHGTEVGRFLVDATGLHRFLARRAKTIEPYRRFGASAAYVHFEGLRSAALEELGPGNEIRIVLRPDGWGWVIPLPRRRLSVGLVAKSKITPEQFEEGLLRMSMIRQLTSGASRSRTTTIGNVSFRNTTPSGPRYVAIGDAACFLDPVFSSGVTLAMRGAQSVADVLGPALEADAEAAPSLLETHHASMHRAYRTFASLIDRFYNTRFAENVLLNDPSRLPMRRGVVSVLSGDVWRSDNEFQELLLEARRREPSW